MNPTHRFVFAAAVALLLVGGAAAQPGGPAPVSPPFSPYLNLLRGGGSPALNYYGIVRPQQQSSQAIQGVQAGLTSNAATLNDLQNGGSLPATGVAAGYLTHRGYFLTQGGGGGGGRLAGGGGGRR